MIKNNEFGYAERERELNWAAEYAKRELRKHREAAEIDHPDKSITTAKLADNIITAEKISDNSVTATKLASDVMQTLKNINQSIAEEVESRENAELRLEERITQEELGRQIEDGVMRDNIAKEGEMRRKADTALDGKITTEKNARVSADNALSGRITEVEGKAHTHGNKSVIDSISASDVNKWNGIKEQVTKSELNMAISAEARDRASIEAGIIDELNRIYYAIGVISYDGGVFGMELNNPALDGGAFDDASLSPFDCGGFEPITVSMGGTSEAAVMDGGIF